MALFEAPTDRNFHPACTSRILDAALTHRRSSTRPSRGGAPRAGSLKNLPPWLSAFAAVSATILTAIGLFGLLGPPKDRPTEAPSVALTSMVTLESVLVGEHDIEGRGSFENLDPAREEVLFVGRPAGVNSELWVAVEAALAASEQQGSLQSGLWSALRPAPPPAAYRWRAILWPSAAGAAGTEDLQQNGPDSQFVLAKSEEWVSEPSP